MNLIDPNFPSAKVICHSKAPNGEELITLEIELHRFILPEFNTHRSFSRNFQSSRAVPIEKMIEQVRNNPAMPVHWGKNQKGMVAENELDLEKVEDAKLYWKYAAADAILQAECLIGLDVHKQLINRLLEPFMKTKGVVTATRTAFEAFFKLRCHKDAQPEIKLLAERMRQAIDGSNPEALNYGDYHLPYIKHNIANREEAKITGKYLPIDYAVKISCSCTAQISYRSLDDSLDKALKVYGMLNLPVNGLYSEDPPHYSPTEHVVKVMDERIVRVNPVIMERSGNFHSTTFWQYRKALEMGMEYKFLENTDEV
jgi:hypothetical protein